LHLSVADNWSFNWQRHGLWIHDDNDDDDDDDNDDDDDDEK